MDHSQVAVAPLFHGAEFNAESVGAARFDFGDRLIGGRNRRQLGTHRHRVAAVLDSKPAAREPCDGSLGIVVPVEVNRFGHAERARLKPLPVRGRNVAVFHDNAGQPPALGSKL